jgi:hypothetical protein
MGAALNSPGIDQLLLYSTTTAGAGQDVMPAAHIHKHAVSAICCVRPCNILIAMFDIMEDNFRGRHYLQQQARVVHQGWHAGGRSSGTDKEASCTLW